MSNDDLYIIIKKQLQQLKIEKEKSDNKSEIYTEHYIYQFGIDVLEEVLKKISRYKGKKNVKNWGCYNEYRK